MFLNDSVIKSPQQLAVIIGDYFEEASKNLLNYKRLCTNCEEEVCPDLVSLDGKTYIESKACKVINAAPIKTEQLQYYKDFVDFNFPFKDDPNPVFKVGVKYMIWFYGDYKAQKFKEDVHKEVSKTEISCYLIPLDLILFWCTKAETQVQRIKKSFLDFYIDSIDDMHLIRTNINLLPVYETKMSSVEFTTIL